MLPYSEKKRIFPSEKQVVPLEMLLGKHLHYEQALRLSQAFFEKRGCPVPFMQEQHFKQFKQSDKYKEIIVILHYAYENDTLSHRLMFYQAHDIFRQDFVTIAEMDIKYTIGLV